MIWERQSDESAKAYRAFCDYRDSGPERSLRKVAERLSKSSSLIRRWSRRHGWVGRVEAFQKYEEEIRREASEAASREAATRLAQREIDLRERVFENEERAVQLEKEMLDRFEQTLEMLPLVECEEFVEKDGTPVRCIIKPAIPDAVLAIQRLHTTPLEAYRRR